MSISTASAPPAVDPPLDGLEDSDLQDLDDDDEGEGIGKDTGDIEQLEKQVYELRLERSKEPDYRINCPVLAHLEEEASHGCCPAADQDMREFLERAV